MAIDFVSVTLHCVHSRFWMPFAMQVGCVVVNHAPNLWSVLAIDFVSVAPQRVHSRFWMPFAMQVGCVVVNHAPNL
ncbi:hypothetical protein [Hominenteromicrobium sp.]|uniref:hypothetical protein n=1 Tax=Hominenteromicrobium sp. TaxID=3073581 RepID=UPI003A91AF9B